MKFRQVVEEMRPGNGWWVRKSKEIECFNMEHGYIVKTKPEMFGLQRKDIYGKDTLALVELGLQKGWSRIRDYGAYIVITLPKMDEYNLGNLFEWWVRHRAETPADKKVYLNSVTSHYWVSNPDYITTYETVGNLEKLLQVCGFSA